MKIIFNHIKTIRLLTGLKNIWSKKWKAIFPVAFIIATYLFWYYVKLNILTIETVILSKCLLCVFSALMIAILIIGTLLIVSMLGTPLSAKRIEKCLYSVGFKDKSGETPVLISRYKEAKAEVFEFYSPTIPLNEFENKCTDIETALNVRIVSLNSGKDFQHVIIKSVSANNDLPDKIEWDNALLSDKDSELLLGESQIDKVTADLKVTPHILIGGSSGSGKSVLLKLLLMQCFEKGHDVYIADFKGGVDFCGVWKRKCNIITQQEKLINRLEYIVEELNSRKQLFLDCECANIEQYNKLTDCDFHRIIFACDEVAELLDKTGLDKESKAEVAKIESMLSTIARQGRAFGIHLILATQRPDSEILKGQIKNNIDLRICGRVDKVLSQIILDNSDGAEKIPKDKQGVFLTNTGVLFKAYYFDDSEW